MANTPRKTAGARKAAAPRTPPPTTPSQSGSAVDRHGIMLADVPDELRPLVTLWQTWREPPPEVLAKLPKNIDKNATSRRCDVCNGYHKPASLHLDYMGHADVTEALLAADPLWNWEPMAVREDGSPRLVLNADHWPIGLWIRLTVLGVTRIGYGSCEGGKDDAVKELIGDAIRNAALRFGIAVTLWSKAEGGTYVAPPPPSDEERERADADAAHAAAEDTQDPPRSEPPAEDAPARTDEPGPASGDATGTPAAEDTDPHAILRAEMAKLRGAGAKSFQAFRRRGGLPTDVAEWPLDQVFNALDLIEKLPAA